MLELEAEASCDAMGERVDESCLVGVGRWKPAAETVAESRDSGSGSVAVAVVGWR